MLLLQIQRRDAEERRDRGGTQMILAEQRDETYLERKSALRSRRTFASLR